MPLRIRDVMVKNVITVDADYSVMHAASIMNRGGIGCLIVVQNEAVEGIVTERDLLKKIVAEGMDPEKTYVKEVMSRPVIVVGPDFMLEDAVRLMVKNKIKKLPVIERIQGEEKLVGLVTLTDIARFQPRIIETMKELFVQEQQLPPKSMEKVMNFYVV